MHAPVSDHENGAPEPKFDYARNAEGKILACMTCHGALTLQGGGPYCASCKMHWAEITLVAVSANE